MNGAHLWAAGGLGLQDILKGRTARPKEAKDETEKDKELNILLEQGSRRKEMIVIAVLEANIKLKLTAFTVSNLLFLMLELASVLRSVSRYAFRCACVLKWM